MIYKALESFAGKISMFEGEVQAIADKAVAESLLKAGYIEEVKAKAEPKPVVAEPIKAKAYKGARAKKSK